MTDGDWAIYELLFGREAMLKARAEFTEARRKAHRRRMAAATTFWVISVTLILGATHGFILLMVAAFDGVSSSL